MLHRVSEREEIASGIFQSIPQRDQFLPAIHGDQPAILEIALEFFGFDTEIDNVAVSPDERMERLDIHNSRTIRFSSVNFNCSSFAEFDGDNSRRRISAEKECIFLEFHGCTADYAHSAH